MSIHEPQRFVLAHGFTQTAKSWTTIASSLTSHFPTSEVRAVDLPGHASASDVRGDLWSSARYLLDQGGSGTYIGYSMGGRVALHAALLRPDAVERLVLIGATAGIDDAAERHQRRVEDKALAARVEELGVEAFVDEWLANPLFARLTSATDLRSDRLRNTASGLAASLRSTGTGTQEPLWDRLGEIRCSTLVLVGESDSKFTQIGQRLVAELPNAILVVVPGAGHSVHLESPEATADAIVEWMTSAFPEL